MTFVPLLSEPVLVFQGANLTSVDTPEEPEEALKKDHKHISTQNTNTRPKTLVPGPQPGLSLDYFCSLSSLTRSCMKTAWALLR